MTTTDKKPSRKCKTTQYPLPNQCFRIPEGRDRFNLSSSAPHNFYYSRPDICWCDDKNNFIRHISQAEYNRLLDGKTVKL